MANFTGGVQTFNEAFIADWAYLDKDAASPQRSTIDFATAIVSAQIHQKTKIGADNENVTLDLQYDNDKQPRFPTLAITPVLQGAPDLQPRGQNGTGRWDNLGTAPVDGSFIGFDYWERIFIDPTLANLGNVVSTNVFDVTLQNTYRRDNQTINAINNNAGEGIELTGTAPPANIAALQDKIYTVTVSTQGPPVIDGTIDFVTTYGTLAVTVIGTRIIIFPYPPQRDVKESLKWKTDILRAANGVEQRHSHWDLPRQFVEYEFRNANQEEINRIQHLLMDWTTRVFGVPVWWDEQALRLDVGIGDTRVYLRDFGTRYADFRVGGLAMVYQEFDDGTYQQETLEISAVFKDGQSPESENWQVQFATPFTQAFDGEFATIVPVLPGIMPAPPTQSTKQAGDYVELKARFESIENLYAYDQTIDVADYPQLDDFEGVPTIVITDPNYLSNGLEESYVQKRERIDLGGIVSQLTQEKKGRRVMQWKWQVDDDDDAWKLRTLLYNLRGRHRAIWVPTNRNDFTINSTFAIANTTIDVDSEGFVAFIGADEENYGIRIEKDDGSISYHRITNAVELDATTERLTIDPVAEFSAAPSQIVRADMLILSRQNKDNVDIIHRWNDAESDVIDEWIETEFIGDVR